MLSCFPATKSETDEDKREDAGHRNMSCSCSPSLCRHLEGRQVSSAAGFVLAREGPEMF